MATIRSTSTSRTRRLQPISFQQPATPSQTQRCLLPRTQTRNATYIPRPKRPYTFTQLLTLSDGSTFLHRTTSPAPVYKSTKDTRNTPLWNPSNARMANIEEDEAGRLRAFRRKFGRAFDSREGEPAPARVEDAAAAAGAPSEAPTATQEDDGVVKGVFGRDARAGAKSEGGEGGVAAAETAADVESEVGKTSSPPPAALKTQKEAEPTGQGMGTTGGWGEDFGEDDNLMDLISRYGTNDHAQKLQQQQAQTSSKTGGGKKK